MLTLCAVKCKVCPSDSRFKTLYHYFCKRQQVLEHYSRVVVGCCQHRCDQRNFILRSHDLGEFVHTQPHSVIIQHELFVELPIGSEFVYNALNYFDVNDKQGDVAHRCLESVLGISVLVFDALTVSVDNRVTMAYGQGCNALDEIAQPSAVPTTTYTRHSLLATVRCCNVYSERHVML